MNGNGKGYQKEKEMPITVMTKALSLFTSLVFSLVPMPQPAEDWKAQKKNIDVFKKVSPSVVYIYNVQTTGQRVYGSGVVFSEAGDIITAAHVTKDYDLITCEFVDGTSHTAMVILRDEGRDLATLKLDTLPEKLHPIKFREKAIKIGKPLYALGSPFKQKFSLSKGIVSQIRNEVVKPGAYIIMGALQTDASLNPGNSGGAIVDDKGQLVGIASLLLGAATSTGVAYGIPVAELEKFIGGN